MKRKDVRINNPCTESWDAMTGDAKTRFCDKCQTNVVNLSAMTEREAKTFLDEAQKCGGACIVYKFDAAGNIAHKPEPIRTRRASLVAQGRGLKKLIAAAAMVPMLAAATGCDTPSKPACSNYDSVTMLDVIMEQEQKFFDAVEDLFWAEEDPYEHIVMGEMAMPIDIQPLEAIDEPEPFIIPPDEIAALPEVNPHPEVHKLNPLPELVEEIGTVMAPEPVTKPKEMMVMGDYLGPEPDVEDAPHVEPDVVIY